MRIRSLVFLCGVRGCMWRLELCDGGCWLMADGGLQKRLLGLVISGNVGIERVEVGGIGVDEDCI